MMTPAHLAKTATKRPPVAEPNSKTTQENQDRAAKKRRQYMMYQRRHRARQNERAKLLEDQVAQLMGEVSHLERMHQQAARLQHVSRLNVRGTHAGVPAQLVREYYRRFEHGYSLSDGEAQAGFVRSMVAVDIRGQNFTGAEELFRQWQLYSQFFGSVHLTARHMEIEAQDDQTVIIVSTSLRLRQRRDVVPKLFPSLSGTDELIQDLLDAPLNVKSSVRFVFDADNHLTWLGAEMDFLGALTGVFGSFQKACTMLEATQLDTTTGYIMVDPEVETEKATVIKPATPDRSARLDVSFILCADPVGCH